MWQLQHFDIDDFLANYWQKKPLLIRQAIPGFESVVSPEELAGLACESGVHSRLVVEKDAESPWQLRYGPFNDNDFTSLPETHYSLLVSECEKWLPELRELVEQFSFIPRWRIDDLMISYAPDQGSVGPHIDEYDVFLIQANGQRRWSIEDTIRDQPELLPGLDLAIMREFSADREWILQPGDLLYLPPRIAHHGVAVGDGCMTYSVGFRAPSTGDIMDSLLTEADLGKLTERRYFDPPLDRKRNPAEIIGSDIEQFKMLISNMLQDADSLWPDIIGKLVSDCTLSEDIPIARCTDFDEVAAIAWQRHPDARVFYHADAASEVRLYFNGQVRLLPATAQHSELCQALCNQPVLEFTHDMPPMSAAAQQLVVELVNAGALLPADQEDD